MIESVCELYQVQRGDADWPNGMNTRIDRDALCALVRKAIDDFGKIGRSPSTYEIYRHVRDEAHAKIPSWKNACIVDWMCACVERACHEIDAVHVWVIR